ncbi:Hypothetical protein DEACI_3106 [Acididesulfobacillus acetoxydans]|uniref:Uncharacterized protein n=1 Tax=Acididesulfobacillus acetoxydans TaxID=1561005 RepID=A0A8S0WH46_9FIRM|nr:hypothetical protein [Acididesulfobacillus acetoxydans]CAA7602432.1 Hypothetical protein DEACI_3106 [Acididesulfobacillus acetoxydans]CEJ08333.1 Hypothetical protein DEACI_2809 [Acididesulfobacillus acetoxydans]
MREINHMHVVCLLETLPRCFQAFYGNAAEAIARGSELAVKSGEARQTMKIIELAELGNLEKRTVTLHNDLSRVATFLRYRNPKMQRRMI